VKLRPDVLRGILFEKGRQKCWQSARGIPPLRNKRRSGAKN